MPWVKFSHFFMVRAKGMLTLFPFGQLDLNDLREGKMSGQSDCPEVSVSESIRNR